MFTLECRYILNYNICIYNKTVGWDSSLNTDSLLFHVCVCLYWFYTPMETRACECQGLAGCNTYDMCLALYFFLQLWDSLIKWPRLALNSLCGSCRPWTFHSCASTSRVARMTGLPHLTQLHAFFINAFFSQSEGNFRRHLSCIFI